FAARLVGVELAPPLHGTHHARGVVKNLQRGGAEHRAMRGRAFEIKRDVEVLGCEQRRRRPARGPELEFVALAHTASGLEQFAQRDAEWRLVLTGTLDVTRQRENLESWGL